MKNDKDGKPLRAKSCIVVLGNSKECLYQKLQRYALVVKYTSLCLLTTKSVGDKRILQQINYKNAFCNTNLTDDEVTVIRPLIGDPDFQDDEYLFLKKTLYGLRQPPNHWYNIINGILLRIGLNTYLHDPCLLSGVLTNPSSTEGI